MDPLYLAIAIGPLSVYLLVLGFVNLSARPMVVSGSRDVAALSVGIFGFALAGPMQLFLPEAAAARFGLFIWPMMILLYSLSVSFLALSMRPRLVIYNVSLEKTRTVLAETAQQLDPQARWAGLNLSLPSLGVELHLEGFAFLRNVQLVSTGPEQSFGGWRYLRLALTPALRAAAPARSPAHSVALLACGAALLFVAATNLLSDQQAVVASFRQMLRW